jgi:hypothetical protein
MALPSSHRIVISGPIVGLASAGIFLTIFMDNGLYLMCTIATLYALLLILWRSDRPGILVFAFLMQWAQVVTFVVWMDVLGYDVNHLSPHGGIAVVMSCFGLVVMAGVLAQMIAKLPIPSREQFYQQARLINEKKILILYLASTLFLGGIGLVVSAGGGLAQIVMTFASLKWVFFLVYAYVSWINKKNRLILLAMILFEFSTSLYSYFSSFKEVILMTIILAMTFIEKISFKQVLYGLLIAFFVGFLLITWTAIKTDYRAYLNKGTRQQTIEVSRSEAFNKIGDKISSLSWKNYQLSMNLFLYRVQYIYHLAKTMDRVPDILPYEYGGLWWNNISFVLEPRLFFPDKPRYEATQKTTKYTGINYAGFKQGASFSLGYFADSYIDFGYTGMIIPLAIIALFVGLIYRSFYKLTKLNILFRFALINIVLYEFISFESDGLFLFGRLLLMFLVFYTLGRTVLPTLQRWLYKAG